MARANLVWPGFALLLGLLALALNGSASTTASWDWQPDLAWRQPWRWWTAALLHWSPRHLWMNLGGCAALAWLGWRAGATPRSVLAWAMAWPLTQLGLLLQPELLHYAGLSGVLHAGAAALALQLWQRSERRERLLGLLLAAGLLAKLLLEQPWLAPTQIVPGWDFALAPLAHATGAAAGALSTCLVGAVTRIGTRLGTG